VEGAAEAGRERGVTQKSGLITPTRAVRTVQLRARRGCDLEGVVRGWGWMVVVGGEQWWWVVVPTGASASASAVSWEDGLDYWP
jgi:hypothetical protein